MLFLNMNLFECLCPWNAWMILFDTKIDVRYCCKILVHYNLHGCDGQDQIMRQAMSYHSSQLWGIILSFQCTSIHLNFISNQ